jgi:hypothetical protein
MSVLNANRLHCWYVCTQCQQIKLQVVHPRFRCVFTFNKREFCRKRFQKCCHLLLPIPRAQYQIPSWNDPVNVQIFQHKNRQDGNTNKKLIITFLSLDILSVPYNNHHHKPRIFLLHPRSLDVGIVTRLQAGILRNRGSIPGIGMRFMSAPKRLGRLWGPTSLLLKGYRWGLSQG